MTYPDGESLWPIGDDGLYKDRDIMHRYMGPSFKFPCCGGRGVTYGEDNLEKYCTCAAGQKRYDLEAP